MIALQLVLPPAASQGSPNLCLGLVDTFEPASMPPDVLVAAIAERARSLNLLLKDSHDLGRFLDTRVDEVVRRGRGIVALSEASNEVSEPRLSLRSALLSLKKRIFNRQPGIGHDMIEAHLELQTMNQKVEARLEELDRQQLRFEQLALAAARHPNLRVNEELALGAIQSLQQLRLRLQTSLAASKGLQSVVDTSARLVAQSLGCTISRLCVGQGVFIVRDRIPRNYTFGNDGKRMEEARYLGRLENGYLRAFRVYVGDERYVLPSEIIRAHQFDADSGQVLEAPQTRGAKLTYTDGTQAYLFGLFPNDDHLGLVGQGLFRRMAPESLKTVYSSGQKTWELEIFRSTLKLLGYSLERLSPQDRAQIASEEQITRVDFVSGQLKTLSLIRFKDPSAGDYTTIVREYDLMQPIERSLHGSAP